MNFKWNLNPLLIIALVFSVVFSVYGQSEVQKILPGSMLVSGKFMQPYTNKWKVTLITPNGDKRFFQIWTDYMQKMEFHGKTYIHRIQDIYNAKGKLMKTQMNFVNENTLVPVNAYLIGTKGSYNYFNYDGKHVTGIYTSRKDKTKEIKFDKTFSGNVFDWSLYGMLLAGLPLKVDFHATLPIYEYPNQKDGWLNVDVNKKEMLTTLSGKKIETYKVETNQNMIFSISKEAPYIIKLIFTTPKGAKLIWEMM